MKTVVDDTKEINLQYESRRKTK